MISFLKSLLTRWFGAQQPTPVVVYPTDEPAATTALAELHPASPQLVAFDENLYDKAKTQWQFGDWQGLATMDDVSLNNHPEGGKLYLLRAAAEAQLGRSNDAMSSVKKAQQRGIAKKLIAQVLIGGLHNTLGSFAAISGQKLRSLQHFEKAISIGKHGETLKLVVKARADQQLDMLGLLPGSVGRLQQCEELESNKRQAVESTNHQDSQVLRPISSAHTFYINLGGSVEPTPFLLIDSKSLPRSGLHYLKSLLSKIFEENFSFCERYQEPGCCNQMPCAMTSYASYAKENRDLRIRLTKSHDFDLTDPIYSSSEYLQQIVLVRDPIYVLTSWYAIEHIELYRDHLLNAGINPTKIWLAHEKEIIEQAFQVINEEFIPQPREKLITWLDSKSLYIKNFTNKWNKSNLEDSNIFVVKYEEINGYIEKLIDAIPVSSEVRKRYLKRYMKFSHQFEMRLNPYQAPVEALTKYIEENKFFFQEACRKINT